MPFNDQSNPLNYPANNLNPFRRFREARAPTPQDSQNFRIGDFWIDSTTLELYFLVDKQGDAFWILLSSGPGPGVETLTGNNAVPVPADGVENINIVGTGNVIVTGDAGTNTLTISDTGSATETLTGNTGGTVGPDGADNINVIGMAPLRVAGNPGTNTLTIENDGSLAEDYVTDSGTAVPALDILNVLGGTAINTSGAGNTITIDSSADVATQYTEDTGIAVPVANNLNVSGGTSISTTGAGDTVTIDADPDLANQYTTDSGIAIPVANNLNVFGDGPLTTSGSGDTIIISHNPTVDSFNLGFTLSAGTFSITAANGSALSSTNKGFVRIAKKSAPGTFIYLPITANQTFIDSSGASTIIGNLFGLTTAIAHADDIPFYLYGVVNDAENDVAFMVSRYPITPISPIAAKIGQSGSAIASTQGSFFSLKSVTTSNFEQNPATRLGSFRMTMNASDDWEVSALALNDGMGQYQENIRFAVSAGQFGAKAGNSFIDNGGTAPTVGAPGSIWGYEIIEDIAQLDAFVTFTGAGLGAVILTAIIPYVTSLGGNTSPAPFLIDSPGGIQWIGTTSIPGALNHVQFGGTNTATMRILLNTDAIINGSLQGRTSVPILFS